MFYKFDLIDIRGIKSITFQKFDLVEPFFLTPVFMTYYGIPLTVRRQHVGHILKNNKY